jgi:succinate dehydrogenase / fumarate reductase flavoprotein subunit
MYHQFKELADVDITAEPMEVGPTCHYVMGGVEVDPDTAAALVPGLFAAGEVAGGMHGSNRLGGNSLTDLLVFGRRAGMGAVRQALARLDELRARVAKVSVEGGHGYHPGWHLALDLRNMIIVSEAIAKAALERQESRGGHTRDDYPQMSADWRKINLVCRLAGDAADPRVELKRQPMDPMRTDLISLFETDELKKYLTGEELPAAVIEEKE